MKKLLALVLAMVMTLGLATVSSSAAFSDADSINYKEAVDVMSAIGVLNGTDKGTFEPAGTLTREAAAKIICYMLLGEKTAEKLAVDKAPFKDVEAGRWSAPYIAYCAANKIVDGVGDGTFAPTAKLTGHAFGKMLLTALGIEGEFTGNNWAINVATAIAKNELDDEVSSVVLSKDLTREQAAQFAFNAVKFNGTEKVFGVKRADNSVVTFDDRTDALLYAAATTGATYLGKVENVENSLLDEVFDVTVTNGNDKFGRPAVVYANNDWDDDLTFADKADYTFTVGTAATLANAAAVKDAINKELKITGSKQLVFADGDAFTINGDPADAMTFAKGDEVEVFMNGSSKTDVKSVVVTHYDLVKVNTVTKLTSAVIKANADNADSKIVNATSKIVLKTVPADGTYELDAEKHYDYNTMIAGFDYEKGDYILTAKNAAKKILASKAATTVSGTVSSIKSSKVNIDGTYYAAAEGFDAPGLGDDGTWVLDPAGKLAAALDVTEKTTDFIYIYSINKKGTDNEGIVGSASYTAYGVKSDGTKASYTLEISDGKIKGSNIAIGDKAPNNNLNTLETPIITAYKINSKGNLEVASSDLAVGDIVNSTYTVSKTDAKVANGKYATDKTVFIFQWVTSSKVLNTKVVTGYKNVDITAGTDTAHGEQSYYVVSKSSEAVYVFVAGKAATVGEDTSVTYAIKNEAVVETENADGDSVFTYTFLSGEGDKVVEVTEKNNTVDTMPVGTLFAYEVKDSKISLDGFDNYLKDGAVTFVSGSQIQVTGSGYGATIDTSAAKLYTITRTVDGADVTVEVEDGASFSSTSGNDGHNVAVCYDKAWTASNDAKVVAIYVLNGDWD